MFKDTYVQEAELYLQPEGIFAIPFFVDPLVMYWNRDMFSSAGIANPPSRWSEFPLLASKLSVSDSNANIIKSVASLGEYRNIDNAKAIVSALIMQAGSPITYYEGEILRSSLYLRPEGSILIPSVAALNFFTDYSDPKKSVYSWNRSIPSSKQFFLSGNLATYFGFASEAQDIKEKNPNLNFDVAMLPQILDAQTKVTFGKIYGFAFLRSSVNTQVAFNLISGITSADAVNVLLEHVYVAPARRDVISAGSPDPAREVFNNSALIAKGWLDPDTRGTDQIFQDMVENVTTGRMDVDSSAQKASLELDNLLQ
jgi:ABC-type glycerol-3-phosphate transport system substrate-binding protein